MIGIPRSAKAAMVAATTFGLISVGAPAAHASGDTILGGCFAESNRNTVLTNGQNQGIIAIASVTRDDNGLVEATVQCWIAVNSVEAPGTRISFTGGGVQAAQQQISYTAGAEDTVQLCEDVQFRSVDSTHLGPICGSANEEVIPGPSLGPINQIFPNVIDPALCPDLRLLAGNYSVITIESDGDVWLSDPLGLFTTPIYDCP